jgi:hypothetical protein
MQQGMFPLSSQRFSRAWEGELSSLEARNGPFVISSCR